MANQEKLCGNKDCDRWVQIGTGSHTINRTQTDYCSFYCRLYTEQGLSKVAVPDTLGRNNMRFPPIERWCDACGKTIELIWNDHRSNRCFCDRTCHFKMRSDKSVRRPELRYQMLRLMRDHPQEVWNIHEISDLLDKSLNRYRVNWRILCQVLRVLKSEKDSPIEQIEQGVYRLKAEAYQGPLLRFVSRNGS